MTIEAPRTFSLVVALMSLACTVMLGMCISMFDAGRGSLSRAKSVEKLFAVISVHQVCLELPSRQSEVQKEDSDRHSAMSLRIFIFLMHQKG